jgi:hypothetical protein
VKSGTQFAARALIVSLSRTSSFCQGGPPLVTDDPDTPGSGHWEFNVATTLRGVTNGPLTLNVAEEVPVNRGAPSVELATGARYDATQFFRFGSELKYDIHEHSGSVIPQIWFAFPHEITFKTGFSFGFDRNRENFVRFVIEAEL